MTAIKKILVCLDRTELDPTLIKYCSFICSNSEAEEVFFINILKNFDIPEEVQKEFPKLIESALGDRKSEIREDIKQYFKSPKVKVNLIVDRASSGTRVILKELDRHGIDLLVLGRKRILKGSGLLTHRLARRASTNLLIIPEGSESKLAMEPQVKKILVPVDFSRHSLSALKHAIRIGREMNQEVEIICVNAYKVPVGYHYTGKSFGEFSEIMKKHAQRNFDEFVKKVDSHGLRITTKFVLDKKEDFVACIYDFAVSNKVDGMIFGAKGRTATSALFLGSIAEKMIKLDSEFPLMVVRQKGDNAGFLDYIKEI